MQLNYRASKGSWIMVLFCILCDVSASSTDGGRFLEGPGGLVRSFAGV